jgi:hypothetical protein
VVILKSIKKRIIKRRRRIFILHKASKNSGNGQRERNRNGAKSGETRATPPEQNGNYSTLLYIYSIIQPHYCYVKKLFYKTVSRR